MIRWRPVIYTINPHSGREYRLHDDRGRQWFIHYGVDGSGFGFLTWKCKRQIGFDYLDLGHGFPVEMRKGPFHVLFSGQVVRIFERSGQGDEIEVWALGWIHVASADIFNRVYCDNRWSQWQGAEDPDGNFRPDYFDHDANDRLYLKPKRGLDFSADDYSYLRYTFGAGEVATRLVASYDVALPGSWPGKMEVRDSNDNVLWSVTTTGTGSLDLKPSGSPTYFEVRFYVTAAGENTADEDTVYGKLTGAKVYSVDVSTLDAKVIADDLVESVLSLAGHGLSDDVRKIEAPGLALEPAVFDRDMTPAQILAWCVKFGDEDGNPLAWGVTLDDRRRLFLETVDLTTVKYAIQLHRATLERGGDWGESAQKIYGVYTDSAGVIQRTADRVNQDVIDRLSGYYRRMALQISGTADADKVLAAVDLYLSEGSEPAVSGSFVVKSGAQAPSGRFVPFDEIQPGGLVQVREWRAHEATLTPTDYRDQTTTFALAGVRIDEDARTAELIPRASSDEFARNMAIIQELIG